MSYARKMARSVTALATLGLIALAGAPAQAKTLAKVNNVEISDDDVKLAMEDLAAGIPRQLEGKAREESEARP